MTDPFAPVELPTKPAFDPFAPIVGPKFTPPPKPTHRVLYMSGSVSLLSLPDADRLWFGYRDVWYRRLCAHGFLWLQEQFRLHVKRKGLSDNIAHVPEQFEFIRQEGIRFGAFMASQVKSGRVSPRSFVWLEGFPRHVDREYFES